MVEYKQDMPPKGGYAPITYKRVPIKPGWNVYLKAAMVIGTTALGMVGYHKTKEQFSNEDIEMRCGRLALLPLLQAEVDRMSLKQLKRNRQLEAEIMKGVPGWEVGKFKHLPVYSTLEPDEYYKPALVEYYAHAPESEMYTPIKVWKFQV